MNLRPEQSRIAQYTGGLLMVSAVPGSGKTTTLSALAAQLIAEGRVTEEQEVLVVTFTTSAASNIKQRIAEFLKAREMPAAGYKVLTLHALGNAMIREYPTLAGVDADFQIYADQDAVRDATSSYISFNRERWLSFLRENLGNMADEAERQWRNQTERLARAVIRTAKNELMSPEALRNLIAKMPNSMAAQFLQMGADIYARYEALRNASTEPRLDFDDLISRAVTVLQNDDARKHFAARWPFILEDEAQDSTPLQERILGLLAREHGNWVRVGDPNQAIMTTFTSSNVRFFRDEFRQRPNVRELPLSQSGRSNQKIIDLANNLADWAVREHPEESVRTEALDNRVKIRPLDPPTPTLRLQGESVPPTLAEDSGEPPPPPSEATGSGGSDKPNPPVAKGWLRVLPAFAEPEFEARAIAKDAAEFVWGLPDKTCAILVPTNELGELVEDALNAMRAKAPVRGFYQIELKNPSPVRQVAAWLGSVLRFCASPANMNALADLRETLISSGAQRPLDGGPNERNLMALLRTIFVEQALFPAPGANANYPINRLVTPSEQGAIEQLTRLAAKWTQASVLPVDQLMLVIAQDLFTSELQLAIAYALAASMRHVAANNPALRLSELARELEDIAANKKTYLLGDSLADSGFRPKPNVITVTTMHKAKGLEWDRVYLMQVDQVDFPHDAQHTQGAAWYLSGQHDPATEAGELFKLIQNAAREDNSFEWPTEEELRRRARAEFISERLRLLYVGITRAASELIISHSKQRRNKPNTFALAMARVLGEMRTNPTVSSARNEDLSGGAGRT